MRDRALSLLARREHSRRELALKLLQRDYPADAVASVVEDLADEQLVSDDRFAEEFVRSKRHQGFGPLKIRAELARRGVDPTLAERHLNAAEADWISQARAHRRKRFGEAVPAQRQGWQRQVRYLANRGFTQDQIRRALDERVLD